MGDWNKPALTDQYADFLTLLKAIITDAATLFYSTPSNQPTGAIRWNRSTNLFEEWNGSSWAVKTLAIAGGGTGATTASGARSALGAAASGSNSDISALTAVSSIASAAALTLTAASTNLLDLATGGTVRISSGGTGRWLFNDSGHQLPNHDNSYDLGSGSARLRKIFSLTSQAAYFVWVGNPAEFFPDTTDGSDNKTLQVGHPGKTRGAFIFFSGNENAETGKCKIRSGNVAGATCDIGSGGTDDLIFSTNDAPKWGITSAGKLYPNGNNLYDIGDSSNKVKDIHLAGDLLKAISTWTPSVSAGGSMTIGTVTTYQALYQKLGAWVEFDLSILCELTGTASGNINISLPVAGVAHHVNTSLICNIDSPSGTVANGGRWRQDGSNFYIFKPANANFELGNTYINIQGKYRYV